MTLIALTQIFCILSSFLFLFSGRVDTNHLLCHSWKLESCNTRFIIILISVLWENFTLVSFFIMCNLHLLPLLYFASVDRTITSLVPRSRQVAQSCPTLCDPLDCSPASLLCLWDFPGKSTGVGVCVCSVLLVDMDFLKLLWAYVLMLQV